MLDLSVGLEHPRLVATIEIRAAAMVLESAEVGAQLHLQVLAGAQLCGSAKRRALIPDRAVSLLRHRTALVATFHFALDHFALLEALRAAVALHARLDGGHLFADGMVASVLSALRKGWRLHKRVRARSGCVLLVEASGRLQSTAA
jgi:hypothetical protein